MNFNFDLLASVNPLRQHAFINFPLGILIKIILATVFLQMLEKIILASCLFFILENIFKVPSLCLCSDNSILRCFNIYMCQNISVS